MNFTESKHPFFVSSVSQTFISIFWILSAKQVQFREKNPLFDFITWICHINFAWRKIDQICNKLKIPDLTVIFKKKTVNYFFKKRILFLFVTKAQSKETSMMKHSVNWWILSLKAIMVSWQ